MIVVISDTPVLLDLEHSEMIEPALGLPLEFAVCDALYEAEIQGAGQEKIFGNRLRIEMLDDEELLRATMLRRSCRGISVSDSFALAIGEARKWPLLIGGGHLHGEGTKLGIECRNLLWLIGELERAGTDPGHLGAMLERLAPRSRCTMPAGEIERRREAIRTRIGQ